MVKSECLASSSIEFHSCLPTTQKVSHISDKFFRDVELDHLQEEAISPNFIECLFIIKECRHCPRVGLRVVYLVCCVLNKFQDLIRCTPVGAETGLVVIQDISTLKDENQAICC